MVMSSQVVAGDGVADRNREKTKAQGQQNEIEHLQARFPMSVGASLK
jgi:hypothetical protein